MHKALNILKPISKLLEIGFLFLINYNPKIF